MRWRPGRSRFPMGGIPCVSSPVIRPISMVACASARKARWRSTSFDRTVTTRVRDGGLTLHSMAGAVMNKLCFLEITSTTPPGETSLVELNIDFQPSGAQRVNGYAPDSGEVLDARENGWTYGWDYPTATFERDSRLSPDQRYDTGASMLTGNQWHVVVPNGWWAVSIACGDATDTSGVYRVNAEGVQIVDGQPTSTRRFVEGEEEIEVRDGEITLEAGAGSVDLKVDFIDMIRVPSGAG